MRFNEILENNDFKRLLKEIEELERNRKFCRHGMEHIFDVARVAYIISLEKGIGIDKDIIYAAALLHDIGRSEEYRNGIPHHIAGAETAQKILANTSYNSEETGIIINAIASHRKNENGNDLAKIIYMADKLTRNCAMCEAVEECNWSEEKKNYKMRY